MRYGVRVRCDGEYAAGLALELDKIGVDRIKLRGGGITGEYEVPRAIAGMCDTCMREGAADPLTLSIMLSEHSGPVVGVDVWETRRSRLAYGIAHFLYRFDPKYRYYNGIIEDAMKDFGIEKSKLRGARCPR